MRFISEDVRARVEHAAEEASIGHGRFSGYGRGKHSGTAIEIPLGTLKSALSGNIVARELVLEACSKADETGCDMLSSWAGFRATYVTYIRVADLHMLFDKVTS